MPNTEKPSPVAARTARHEMNSELCKCGHERELHLSTHCEACVKERPIEAGKVPPPVCGGYFPIHRPSVSAPQSEKQVVRASIYSITIPRAHGYTSWCRVPSGLELTNWAMTESVCMDKAELELSELGFVVEWVENAMSKKAKPKTVVSAPQIAEEDLHTPEVCERLNAPHAWEELNPDWREDGDLTARFAKSQFAPCPGCGGHKIGVYVATEDCEVAVNCGACRWHVYADCPCDAITQWNTRTRNDELLAALRESEAEVRAANKGAMINARVNQIQAKQITELLAALKNLRDAANTARAACRDNLSRFQYKNEQALLDSYTALDAALVSADAVIGEKAK